MDVPPCIFNCAGIAKGFLGAGVGVAGLAGAAAATMFFLRKKRSSANESLVGHNLARVHDSVIVTKQKKRVKMATVNKEALPGMHKENQHCLEQVTRKGDSQALQFRKFE
jgi:hypothetical protein